MLYVVQQALHLPCTEIGRCDLDRHRAQHGMRIGQPGAGLIGVSERRSQTASIFAIIIVIVLIAVACDQLWRLGGQLLFPYRRSE